MTEAPHGQQHVEEACRSMPSRSATRTGRPVAERNREQTKPERLPIKVRCAISAPFWVAGGAAGADDHRRVPSAAVSAGVAWRGMFEHGIPVPDAVGRGDVGSISTPMMWRSCRQAVVISRVWAASSVDDGDVRTGIAEPVFERFRTEQMRQRQRDGAHLVNRDMRDAGL